MTGASRGFEISLHHKRNILRVRVWGSWDTALAKKFEDTFQEKINEISAAGNPWHILADFSQFLPQLDDLQRILREQITAAEKKGMEKIGYLGQLSETPACHLRNRPGSASGDRPKYAFFDSEAEAIEWLLSEE